MGTRTGSPEPTYKKPGMVLVNPRAGEQDTGRPQGLAVWPASSTVWALEQWMTILKNVLHLKNYWACHLASTYAQVHAHLHTSTYVNIWRTTEIVTWPLHMHKCMYTCIPAHAWTLTYIQKYTNSSKGKYVVALYHPHKHTMWKINLQLIFKESVGSLKFCVLLAKMFTMSTIYWVNK